MWSTDIHAGKMHKHTK
jgi:hypothetical protein